MVRVVRGPADPGRRRRQGARCRRSRPMGSAPQRRL